MEDSEIVEMYWQRSTSAISETAKKYNKYCGSVAYNILQNLQDAEECVNETYLRAWNAIPPQRPARLATYLGKITRNLSLNKYKQYSTEKRGRGQTAIALSELEECIPAASGEDNIMEKMALTEAIDQFLSALPKTNRMVFVRRYWFLNSVKEIADQYSMSESKVSSMLFRARNQLRQYLEKEGVIL